MIRLEACLGLDVVELERFRHALARWGERLSRRLFTGAELLECRGDAARLAARFAAKEAVLKSLGLGLSGVSWRDIEVTRQPGERPRVRLSGACAAAAASLGLAGVAVSLTHDRGVAAAVALGFRGGPA